MSRRSPVAPRAAAGHSHEMPSPPEPDLRILQANERTLLAWIRTGLALLALGLVVARATLWLHLEHPAARAPAWTWIGIGAMALGAASCVLGAVRFVVARRAVVAGEPHIPGAVGPVIIAIIIATAGAVGIAITLLG